MSETESKEIIKDKFLDKLWSDYRYSISRIDEQSLIISSGALGISLTFVKEIVPLKASIHTGLFFAAIICFAFTITVGFINHMFSARSILKRYIILNNTDFSKTDASVKERLNPWIGRINLALTLSLIVGIVLLITYCIINIYNYKQTGI
jgi:hypothetical protein